MMSAKRNPLAQVKCPGREIMHDSIGFIRKETCVIYIMVSAQELIDIPLSCSKIPKALSIYLEIDFLFGSI